MFREIQAGFAEEPVPTTTEWSLGTVGVLDESGFEKAGTESVAADLPADAWRAKHKRLAKKLFL